jgi:hypothetical protein
VLLVLTASFAGAGCAKPTGSVSGKVSYKGAPLKGGHVIFLKADNQSVWADIGEDGSYSFEKITAGPVQIGVETSSLKPPVNRPGQPAGGARRYSAPPGEENPNKAPDPEANFKRYVAIPEKYETPQSSGLTYDVKSGKQEHDIPLAD